RVVNPDGTTTGGTTKLSNIADGKVAANSKDAVNGGQLHTAKSEIGAIIGGTTINENGKITGPTFSITNEEGTAENAGTIKEAIEKLDAANKGQNTKISETAGKVTTLEGKVDGIVDKGMTFAGDDATADKVTRKLGETLNIHGQNNITVKKDGTAADTLNVKLASDLKNITSITNADADGKPGSKITLGADGVSIANTAAGADGAAGETKTVTIGKDGINAGGMKVTNVAKAEADDDAANKKYVDDAIKNLNTTVTNNANLRYAGDTNEGAVNGEDHLNLPLATGTLKVAGTADQIKTVANNGTITLSLDKKVTDKLAKLGDTASNGRDGKDGASGAQGLTGKDGLNDKTLTDKVNALRNGEAGSVVYTNDAGDRVVKAKDGKYYKADEVKADGTVKTAEENNGKAPKVVENPQARVVNGNGETTVPTTLSNIADGKVAANSKDAVNGGQLYTAKSEIGAIIGGTTINENGTITGPTFSITKADGTAENAGTIKEAIEKLDATNAGQNAKISGNTEKLTKLGETVTENYNDLSTKITQAGTNVTNALTTKGLDFTGNDTTAKVHRDLGTTLTIKGAENFTRTDAETNNIKVVKNNNDLDVKLAENLGNIKSISNTTGEGKPGSTITLGADGVSIANTAAGADGAAGETKTVTIGKDGINAGGMKVTNVAKAEADEDAANKKYVDDAITNLNTTVTNNANLRYAGDTNEGAAAGEDHLNLPLATGTLKVAGTADQIKTVANNGTITLSLDEKVTNKLDKLGDTSSNGRDGKDGTSGAIGLTGKDGLNDKTLTDKVNALRNGEAGSVVYTNDAGDRVVKAKDGKYYKADEVKADGTVKTAEENKGKKSEEVTTPQARVVNPNGETTAPTTLSNIADGKVAANSKDAVNGGQLHTVKSDLATALGGDSKVDADGSFTGPTYNITKDDGTGKEAVNNVGDAISKLDGRINNANTTLANKGLDFTGNDTTVKVHRNLGETLTIKGAENFTREATETNNIKVVKTDNDLDVKLAENLGNIKEIAGNGKDNLVIKNGDATITLKPKKEAEGTNPATPATVDFGDTKVVASNLDASIKYRANDEEAANAKSVKLADGFNFVASTDTTTTAEGPKSGIAIKAEDNGKVTFGLDKATREKVDNAADKNLSNLTDDGKNKVKELAGEAAKAAVTVADGINTTVTTDTTTAGVTTYKVNANDTTVAVNADSLAIAGGDLDATTKVRTYTLDLSDTVKAKLNAINNVGDTASNGRDGVNGTSGATGLTGKDGLNDKTLTDKVNALRNGEAGSVVYTNDAGDRVVKAKDGKYYKADEVKADGTVKTAEENKGKAPEEVKTPQARVVNPNGETTAPTTLSNIADGKVAEGSKEAVNGGQLHTVKSDLATALGGGAKVENGTFTGPTYNITKDDGTGTEAVKNVGDAITKLDGRINNANTVLGNKGLDFTGNDTTDAGKVHRNLGETLTIKGADNFTRTDAETNNIKVVKNNNDLDVKLAENLGNIKEIAGNGKDNLVIKNGDATITLKPKKDAEGTNPATPATVDFGNAKVVAPNLEASITYRANSAEDADAKTVTLQKGLNFVSGDGTAATAEAAKAGITIAADKDGKVVFGLNEATRNAIDNAADKNLSNLSKDGKDKVADLAKTAARDAVKVAAGNNVTVTPETKDGNTTYTVNGRDTTVKAADNGSVSVTGGTLNAKGEREYTVDLTADAKAELGKISDLNTRLGSAEGKITTLQGDMTKAKDDIAANMKAIEANKEAIATNKNAIADNVRDIAANKKAIEAVDAKATQNAADIKKNAQDIKNNTETIKSNTDRIQKVENRVTTAEGKIATNEKAIKDNASAIQSNTKAIGANTTAIAKNANDITKANKEIESLKGNSATKDLSNLTNTGKDTITNLINVIGEHGITVTPSTNTTTRVKTFTAKLNDTVTFGSGDKKITVDGTTGTVTSKAVAADTVKANTVNAKTVQLGDSTGTNTTVTADGIAVTTKNPDGTTSKVEIKNGTVSGLTNTKWDPAKVVTEADRSVVATQGQVKDVTDTLARGRVFVGDTGSTVTVGLGDTLAIKGGATKALTDDNIGVVSTEAKDGKPATMTVKLAKDVKMKDGSTSYDYYLPEIKTNPDGSKEIVKNADGSVKHQLGKDGNPIRLVTTTVNGEGITIAPVKGLDKPTVSLTADGLDNGGNQIHNVAAGTANTDAATVGQVRAAAHALNNRVNEAGAHAAALAAMNPLSYDPLKKSQVMAGVGSYKGNKALALGVAHYANEDTLFNVGVAVGDGSNMVNAGVTYRFGGEYSAVPERYKGGPISSVYVMQDEVSALKAENAEMKEQMKMLMERIEMLAVKA
uniref:YadA-like family protein n=1 Tax=Veillonella sp. 3627 TaxID=2490953 RepID=UPI0013E0CB2E